MKQQSSIQAITALMQDAQNFKRTFHWRKTTVEVYSDYIETEYHITEAVRFNTESHANEWRMYACDNEIIFVLTYYYEDGIK